MRSTILLLLIFLASTAIKAQEKVGKKNYETMFTEKPPQIDGLDDDECWNMVEWSEGFTQLEPYENKAPTQQTSFKILYDNNNLYVFIRAVDTEIDKMRSILCRRDAFDGDFVVINIDSDFDKQTAFSFGAMASGVKGDEMITLNGDNWDESWNPIWFLETSVDDKGWSAELKIPFTQLRFGNKEEHVWGLQVMRHLYRDQERSHWQYIPKGSPGFVHLFGELHGIKNIKPKRQVEILPYVVAKTENFEKQEGNPFATGKKSSISAGVDGKIGITNDFTLDFTINPDFGQVEADPSQVNLSAFESYFSERRPFFIEGKNIYQFRPNNPIVINNFGRDNLFYSRRIGRYPHHYPDTDDGEYVDMPEATTILGAFKLSGKTKNGLSIGILESVTAEEKAEIDNNGERRHESVEPLTNYFIGRVQKDFNKGKTKIGGLVTAVNRDINNHAMNYIPTESYTAGVDFEHHWKERVWYVEGKGVFSNVVGNEEAIQNLQNSSARYFQRPDAEHVNVDSSLTNLTGYGASFKLGRSGQKKIRFQTSVSMKSPGLEYNDIGYMRYTDMIHHGTWMGYQKRDPFSIFRNFYLNTNYGLYWNFEGKLLSSQLNMNFNSQFKNKWRINGSVTRNNESISNTMLRGGPSFKEPGEVTWNVNIRSDYSKKVGFYLGTYHNLGDNSSGRYDEYWTGMTIKPMNALSISFSTWYGKLDNNLQYVETVDFNNEPRYIFAKMFQETVSFTFRVNYSLTPELSIQFYGQPFVSAGGYNDFKRITTPHAENYNNRYHTFTSNEILYNAEDEEYSIFENGDNTNSYVFSKPDYNFRQFRSNVVLRWEYSPGSTVYLVWSQGRTSNESYGRFDYGKDIDRLFGIQPHNVFLLKFSYWIKL